MGIADKYNKATNRFEFQSDSTFEFFKLSDLYNEDPDAVHIIRALWINDGGVYGPSPVTTLEDRYINLPGHLVDTVKEMIADSETVDAINNEKLGFTVRSYIKQLKAKNGKTVEKTCYSVTFVDC